MPALGYLPSLPTAGRCTITYGLRQVSSTKVNSSISRAGGPSNLLTRQIAERVRQGGHASECWGHEALHQFQLLQCDVHGCLYPSKGMLPAQVHAPLATRQPEVLSSRACGRQAQRFGRLEHLWGRVEVLPWPANPQQWVFSTSSSAKHLLLLHQRLRLLNQFRMDYLRLFQ